MEDMKQVYQQHAQTVYKFLMAKTRDPHLAEELAQETFCQALKSLDSFRGDCTPQVWLCAIAKRLWYKELERRGRTAPLEEEHLSRLAAPDDPAGEIERREDRMALYRSLRRLDPETREVIYLRLAGDFSFREIGELMGQSEVWARVRFYRGKERLAKLMTGGGPNE